MQMISLLYTLYICILYYYTVYLLLKLFKCKYAFISKSIMFCISQIYLIDFLFILLTYIASTHHEYKALDTAII